MGLGCRLCPRACGADRIATTGFCGAPDELQVASVCIHRGEEPPLNPIVNIFFPYCNLQCIYCQNYQISKVESRTWEAENPDTIAEKVCELVCRRPDRQLLTPNSKLPTPLIGFVTAAHYADRIPEIIDTIRHKLATENCQQPTIVYNSSGYESVETLRTLEGYIDIYLPDYKYADADLASQYSHAADYPEVADATIREMIRQVGSGLKIDDEGQAYRGLIVRHLVLPGHVDNSIKVLDRLAELTSPSKLHLSLMSQYYPPRPGLPAPLDRTLTAEEYNTVVDHAVDLGLTSGWIQELNASDNYRPDFANDKNPFEPGRSCE